MNAQDSASCTDPAFSGLRTPSDLLNGETSNPDPRQGLKRAGSSAPPHQTQNLDGITMNAVSILTSHQTTPSISMLVFGKRYSYFFEFGNLAPLSRRGIGTFLLGLLVSADFRRSFMPSIDNAVAVLYFRI